MKTIFYVDGYNLYYGCLKHSTHKWLDLKILLAEQILHQQNPDSQLLHINYFTAPILAKVASRGGEAANAQSAYLRALQNHLKDHIRIIKGYYALEKGNLPVYQHPLDKQKRTNVWRLEEKQTDVNIALEAYRDAIKGQAEPGGRPTSSHRCATAWVAPGRLDTRAIAGASDAGHERFGGN